MRALLALPFLAACVHTPPPCEWPRTCEERGDAVDARPVDAKPQPERPADPKPEKDHSRDDNGGSSDDNGGKSDD